MKTNKKKVVFIIIFFVLMILPVISFNFQENVESEIDNRYLTNFPFGDDYKSEESDNPTTRQKINALNDYVSDRLGFRNNFIKIYDNASGKIFGKIVHPTYEQGKDGYIFFKFIQNYEYSDYIDKFVDMLKKIQDYCDSRQVPFLFVFEPEKESIYTDKIPAGINYNADWVQKFKSKLDENKINYIDNTDILKEKRNEGKQVFNVKYDAGHWNDLGAFYAVNNIANALSKDFPDIHKNSFDEFKISTEKKTSLPTSDFKINEDVPLFELKKEVTDKAEDYIDELEIDENYPSFVYTQNDNIKTTPKKLMMFQGSYMNGIGFKFMRNIANQYVGIHSYQNILNFDYYFNIFQPDCVVFEAAQYAFNDGYYDSKKMEKLEFNPALSSLDQEPITKEISQIQYDISKGDKISTIKVNPKDNSYKYGYVKINNTILDLKRQKKIGQRHLTKKKEKKSMKLFLSTITIIK